MYLSLTFDPNQLSIQLYKKSEQIVGMVSILVLLLPLFTTPIISSSLQEDAFKEKKCFAPDTSNVELDYSWVLSNSRWYFPLMSHLDLHRSAADTYKLLDPNDLKEEQLEFPCVYADWEGMSPKITAFGRTLDYEITPSLWDSSFSFGATWRKGGGGKMEVLQTDNKSYLLFLKCWEKDGEATWTVMSTGKVLEDGVKEKVLGLLKELGFSGRHFEQDFSKCGTMGEGKKEL